MYDIIASERSGVKVRVIIHVVGTFISLTSISIIEKYQPVETTRSARSQITLHEMLIQDQPGGVPLKQGGGKKKKRTTMSVADPTDILTNLHLIPLDQSSELTQVVVLLLLLYFLLYLLFLHTLVLEVPSCWS